MKEEKQRYEIKVAEYGKLEMKDSASCVFLNVLSTLIIINQLLVPSKDEHLTMMDGQDFPTGLLSCY